VGDNRKYISGVSRKYLAPLYCFYHGRSTPHHRYRQPPADGTKRNNDQPSPLPILRGEQRGIQTGDYFLTLLRLLIFLYSTQVPPSWLCNVLRTSNYLQNGYEPPSQMQTAMFTHNIIDLQLMIHHAEHRMCAVHSISCTPPPTYVCLCTRVLEDISAG